MCGDGTNDAPALASGRRRCRDASGTQAAREAGKWSISTATDKLIEVTKIGKQLLMTRGSLTTFSIAK